MNINGRGIGAFHEEKSDGRISEQRAESALASRAPLWRVALQAAMNDKENLARKLYEGEGFWWPELATLTAAERRAIIDQIRSMWGLPAERYCECPNRRRGEHREKCTPEKPWRKPVQKK